MYYESLPLSLQFTFWCRDQDWIIVTRILTPSKLIMPKTSFEKLQAERRQLRRSFVRTCNDTSRLLTEHAISDEDLSPLKSAAAALSEQFQECKILDKEIRSIALDEIEDEEEQDAFFDEANEATNLNRGKISKVIFPRHRV